jgi:hypothetical protein
MEWHACYSTPLEVQAHLVKGYLEQFGVPCVIDSHRFGMKPLTFGALGEVRILVRDDWLHVAEGLLRGRERDRRPRLRAVSGRDV